MSTSQHHHGKGFEGGVIYAGTQCVGAHRVKWYQSNIANFDIPAHNDPMGEGIPTSIKTMKAGRNRIDLADAVRISGFRHHSKTDDLMDPTPTCVRLMVGIFRQTGAFKTFDEAREYIVTEEEWAQLWGSIPHTTVEAFSKMVKEGSVVEARRIAKDFNQELRSSYHTAKIKLSPKISDKNNAKGIFVRQRRVQCGVTLTDLESVIQDKSRIRVYAEPSSAFEGRPNHLKPVSAGIWNTSMEMPFRIESSARTFLSKQA